MNFNFAVILFIASLVLGVPWLADKLVLAPARRKKAEAEVKQFDSRIASGELQIESGAIETQRIHLRQQIERQPLWLEYTAGFFPVIVLVFLLRSFLYEPFRIPSGSMLPTLLVGDLILVNKFDYGVRLPVINKKIIDVGSPQRGDVMVFRYPPDPSLDYIKRVVGIPGDTIEYAEQKLKINGSSIDLKSDGRFVDPDRLDSHNQHLETLGKIEHKVLTDLDKRLSIQPIPDFNKRENCSFTAEKLTCTVPPGHYFMMGDNRDNSADSRFWGFVPEENIVGRAFFIWLNFGDLSRIGRFK
jgi:signal peptidase I